MIYKVSLQYWLNRLLELMKCWVIPIIVKNSYIREPGLKYMKIFCGGDFLYWIQNAHIHYFTLKNIMKKPSYDLICGDETIKSIF